MRYKKTYLLIFSILLLLLSLPQQARADCTSPPGIEGLMDYFLAEKTFKFCDGTSWIPMNGGDSPLWTAGTGDDIYFNSGGGNVGIGMASPAAKLDVEASAYNVFAGQFINTNATASNGISIVTQTNSAGDAALNVLSNGGSSQVLSVRNSGNVGIGTASPQSILHLIDSGSSFTNITVQNTQVDSFAGISFKNDAGGWNWQIQGADQDKLYLWNEGRSAVDIVVTNANGNVGIGTTSPTQKLHVIGNIVAQNQIYDLTSNPQGGATLCRNGSSGVHSECSSDRRLKDNIISIDDAILDKVMKLRPVEFDWKNQNFKRDAGFIAQEVDEIFPLAVGGKEEDTYLTFSPGNLVPYLVKALQEQQIEIEALHTERAEMKAQLNELRAANDSTRARLDALEGVRKASLP